MRTKARRLVDRGALVLSLLAPAATQAADIEPIRLSYAADAACPNEASFRAEIRARTDRVRFATGPEPRHFVVRIRRGDDGFVGRLEIASPDGGVTDRSFSGADCALVASSLALVAAVAIDPHASVAPRPPPSAQPVAATTQPRPPPTPPPASPSPPPEPELAPAAPPQRPTEPPLGWAAGLGLAVTAGPAPSALISPTAFGEVAWPAERLWSPTLRLHVLGAATGVTSPSVDEARFRWLAARLELCPLRWPLGEGWTLGPCALGELGVLGAEGRAVAHPDTATRLWAALGVGLHGRWQPRRWFFADFALDFQLPLSRYEFVFLEPRRLVYEVPAVVGGGRWGIGFNFL